MLALLGSVDHSTDSDFLAFDAIDHDKMCSGDNQLAGAPPSRPSEMGEVNQPLRGRDEAGNHAVCRFGAVQGNVVPNLANLTPRLRRRDMRKRG